MIDPFEWRISHRQLLSAIISLVVPGSKVTHAVLGDMGYRLSAIDLPMVDSKGRRYSIDLHLANDTKNVSLIADCKTWPDTIKAEQIAKYMDTPSTNVVTLGGISLADPRVHLTDATFFVLPVAEAELAATIKSCRDRTVDGFGIIRVSPSGLLAVHNELSDADLSKALDDGLEIDVLRLPLERLPYDRDAPEWELANALLTTVLSFFVSRRSTFSLEDLCQESNSFWDYMTPNQHHLSNRIRNEMRRIRRTALSDWLERVATPSGREENWRFKKKLTTRANVIGGYARRHHRYVEVLRDERRDPTKQDFANIDPEQLMLL